MKQRPLASLMENLGDLAGLDMVRLREAGSDREAEPLSVEVKDRSGWIGALARGAALLLRGYVERGPDAGSGRCPGSQP